MCHKGKGTFIDGILEAADNRTLWTCKERGFTYWDFLFSPAWNVSRTEEADPCVLESVTRTHRGLEGASAHNKKPASLRNRQYGTPRFGDEMVYLPKKRPVADP